MTVEQLPPEYQFGKVVGRVIHMIADSSEDVDDKPEARAASGKVIFTPVETIRVVTADGHKAFVTHGPETATLSAAGRLLDAEGRNGIWLVEGTYKVTFELAAPTGVSKRPTMPVLQIAVTPEHDDENPLDLTSAAEYEPPPNTTVRTLLVPSGGTDGQVLTKSGNDLTWADASGGGAWGAITGTLSSQADLQSALNSKAAASHTHSAAQISDSTTTGRSVLTAADAAAARSAIGAGTSNLALGTTSTTAKAGDYQPAAANISDATTTGRSVLTAASAAAARTAIGAGTSSLALGTTSSTAKAGDYKPPVADLPAGSVLRVLSPATARPTDRTDVTVWWIGYAAQPANAIVGDVWDEPV